MADQKPEYWEKIEEIEAAAESQGTGGPVVQPCPRCGNMTVDPAYYEEGYGLRCGGIMNEHETAWICEECEDEEEAVEDEAVEDEASA